MFIYPQSIIQVQSSGQWLPVIVGWLFQGGLLRLLIGGVRAEKEDLLARLIKAGIKLRLCIVWPITIINILAITVIIGGHSKIYNMIYLPDTPQWVLSSFLFLVAVSISYAGRDSLLRLSVVLGCLGIPLFVISFIELARYVNLSFIFPIKPTFTFMESAKALPLLFVFSNVVGLIGFVGPMNRAVRRWLWGAWVLFLPLMLLIIYISLGVLSQEVMVTLRFPLITALDTVRVNWFFFDRISMIYVTTIIFSTLLNVSGLLWLTRELGSEASAVSRFLTKPIVIGTIATVIAWFIPNVEYLEHNLRWIGPIRCIMLFIVAIAGVYFRHQSKNRGQSHA